ARRAGAAAVGGSGRAQAYCERQPPPSRYSVRAVTAYGTGLTTTRTSFCLCGWTVVFLLPPSGSPQVRVSSVPISTSGSTVPNDRPRRSLALYPVNIDRPTTLPAASLTSSKFEEP